MRFTETQRKLLTALACILFCAFSACADKIVYVDDDTPPSGDGTSWTSAYKFLQDALADAESSPKPVEIRVAKGTYWPDRSNAEPNGTGDSEATFQLMNGVRIKGGYAGHTHADLDARDVSSYESILSGDIQENDTSYPQHDNRKRVVDGSHTDRTAVLDGFTIIRGYLRQFDRVPPDFDPEWTARASGGMRNISGSPTILNCTFRRNRCAVFNVLGSNPDFTGCKFEQNNAASSEQTSAMINIESHPEITECIFLENYGYNGGAVFGTDSEVHIAECTFSKNQAAEGGAIRCEGGQLSLTDCRFYRNYAGTGGAILLRDGIELTVENCDFIENEGYMASGGLYAKAQGVHVMIVGRKEPSQ